MESHPILSLGVIIQHVIRGLEKERGGCVQRDAFPEKG
jgi:hypothetical protein